MRQVSVLSINSFTTHRHSEKEMEISQFETSIQGRIHNKFNATKKIHVSLELISVKTANERKNAIAYHIVIDGASWAFYTFLSSFHSNETKCNKWQRLLKRSLHVCVIVGCYKFGADNLAMSIMVKKCFLIFFFLNIHEVSLCDDSALETIV